MADSGSSGALPPARRPILDALSLVRVDSAVAQSAAGIGVVFFLQSVAPMMSQLGNVQTGWSIAAIGSIVLSLLFVVVASIVRRLVRIANVTFAAVFLVALVTWPFAVVHPSSDSPWLYYLMTVATAMAAIGLRLPVAAAYLILVPTVYGAIRLTPAGGGLDLLKASLDTVYAVILGGAILVITTMLRAAASDVDRAQATALERYAYAVRAHATEAERVRVDSIVHDSVLTTLLSAARADTPEAQRLAATMATNAIGHLREAALVSTDDGTMVRVSVVAQEIQDAVEQLEAGFEITASRLGTRSIPAAAGEAVRAAAVQGALNSANHAGPKTARSVRMSAWEGGIQVVVSDDGKGFDPRTVPRERLGVRVSIIERLSNAGGVAEVVSAPGAGTTVTLRWPAHSENPEEDAPSSSRDTVSS